MASEVHYPPESLALHVFIGQAVVGERLIPHGVAGVSQSLCAKLIGLLDARSDQDKEMESLYGHTGFYHRICMVLLLINRSDYTTIIMYPHLNFYLE